MSNTTIVNNTGDASVLTANVFSPSADNADQFSISQALQDSTAAKEIVTELDRAYDYKLVVKTDMNVLFPNRSIDLNLSRTEYIAWVESDGTAQFQPDLSALNTALKSEINDAYYTSGDLVLHKFESGVTYTNDHRLQFLRQDNSEENLDMCGIFDRLTRIHLAEEYTIGTDVFARNNTTEFLYLSGARTMTQTLVDMAFNTINTSDYIDDYDDPYHKEVTLGIQKVFVHKKIDLWENLKNNYLLSIGMDSNLRTATINLDMSNIKLFCHFKFTMILRNRTDQNWSGSPDFIVGNTIAGFGGTPKVVDVRVVFQTNLV